MTIAPAFDYRARMLMWPRAFFVAFWSAAVLTAALHGAVLTGPEMAAATKTDDLTVPTPGEFLNALGKYGKPNWKDEYRAPIPTAYTSRPQAALDLGTLIADGYIAIEAEDSQAVKNTGRDIIAIAKTLGVSQSLLSRGNSIADFAENNEWNTLKEELEATQNEVKNAMNEQHDNELVTLVTVGGWLRGTAAVTDWIMKHYSPAAAGLLRQPGITSYLRGKMDQLSVKTQEDDQVTYVKERLDEIGALVSFKTDAPPALEDVQKINKLSAEVVARISEKK